MCELCKQFKVNGYLFKQTKTVVQSNIFITLKQGNGPIKRRHETLDFLFIYAKQRTLGNPFMLQCIILLLHYVHMTKVK